MSAPVTVLVDPDGTGPEWMYVIVRRTTGIWYEHQYGGTATRQGREQGYLVPVNGRSARPDLDGLFLGRLGGTGLWGSSRKLDEDIIATVEAAVARIKFWDSVRDASEPHQLAVDPARASEVDESWVPVLTPDGPGTLIWPNSD